MHAYSQDLRDRVLGALERGEGPTAISRRYEVSRLWVYQVRKRWEEDGQRHSRQMGGYRRSRIAHKEVQIRQWIAATPDLTLIELSERLAQEGIQIKVSALWHQLDKWGLSFKKNPVRQRAVARGRASGTG
ncbi:MAG: transcriptional regulator [Burkholderiaceae bacterium]|nr:MAG: transcriptional regulator [Burkholderiaceae bacterium]